MKAPVAREPVLHVQLLVSFIVVHDQVQLQWRQKRTLQTTQKFQLPADVDSS